MSVARNDDFSDDTQALQEALDAAAGGVCYLLPRVYRVSGTIIVPAGTTIVGAASPDLLPGGTQ